MHPKNAKKRKLPGAIKPQIKHNAGERFIRAVKATIKKTYQIQE